MKQTKTKHKEEKQKSTTEISKQINATSKMFLSKIKHKMKKNVCAENDIRRKKTQYIVVVSNSRCMV